MKIAQLDQRSASKPLLEPKPKGVSRKQTAALRYLTKLVEKEEKDEKGITHKVLVKPTIKDASKKFGIKEETLLGWLVEDKEFFRQYLDIVKSEVLSNLQELIGAAVTKVKNSGDPRTLELLLRWISAYTPKEQVQPLAPPGWESNIGG